MTSDMQSTIADRHHLTFDTYEEGKLTLEEYLARVVFYRKRPFTRAQFRRFMFAQSKPYPKMIELVARLKVRHGLKIVVVSNEARELSAFGAGLYGIGIPKGSVLNHETQIKAVKFVVIAHGTPDEVAKSKTILLGADLHDGKKQNCSA